MKIAQLAPEEQARATESAKQLYLLSTFVCFAILTDFFYNVQIPIHSLAMYTGKGIKNLLLRAIVLNLL